MRRRALALLAVALALAGCGGAGEGSAGGAGTAELWITRDRGAEVLLTATVPAGLTVLQALDREADVKTRYGGRFVQAVVVLAGDVGSRRDWFWFVNGIEGDRSAAEYRLRAGEVAWWDYRSWRGRMEEPVVVGAFPEPFVHGYRGIVRPAAVRYLAPSLERGACAVAATIGADVVVLGDAPVPEEANVLVLAAGGPERFTARLRTPGAGAGSPVELRFTGDPLRLVEEPERYRYAYQVPRP